MSLSTLAKLAPLDLHAIKEGRHVSRDRRLGSLFSQLKTPNRALESARPYIPGDPIRMIDWRAYGKNNQLIIRERKDQAHCKVGIYIDTNPSMFWPTPELLRAHMQHTGHPTKFEVALRLACAFAFRHLQCGDSVDWVFVNSSNSGFGDSFHFHRSSDVLSVFESLENFSWDELKKLYELRQISLEGHRDHLVYWLSDFLEFDDQEVPAQGKFLFFQILSSLELSISWLKTNGIYFDGISENRDFEGTQLKVSYQNSITKWLKDSEAQLSSKGFHYLFNEGTTIQELSDLLVHLGL